MIYYRQKCIEPIYLLHSNLHMQTLGVNKPLICSSEIEAMNPRSLKKETRIHYKYNTARAVLIMCVMNVYNGHLGNFKTQKCKELLKWKGGETNTPSYTWDS